MSGNEELVHMLVEDYGLEPGVSPVKSQMYQCSLPGFVQSVNGVYIHVIPCTMCHMFVCGTDMQLTSQ